ncbi:MAG: sensor histidine kinase, partial [Anaerolineae bacterium]
MKEQFAANISHELRTPLSLILGFSEVMYFSPDIYGDMVWPPTLRHDVRQIYQNSRRLLDLVNDVLDLSRLDTDQMPICKELSDLGTVIREAIETVAPAIQNGKRGLHAEIPSGLPLLAFDRTRIRQVLINLLNNAARFTDQGSVTVAVNPGDQEIVVSVADTGSGIPEEELGKIFDEFYQVDMSIRRRREGAGLG